jgi:ybaK/ebsC protein
LTTANIAYKTREYPVDESDLSGAHAAQAIGLPKEQLFKTLVLKGEKTGLFVCVIPCAEAIDLKKAARAAGDKACSMLPMKDLLSNVGYMRGACSPIGMKKKLPTFIDESCELFDAIAISAGARGTMLLIAPCDLIQYVGAIGLDLILMG